MSALLRSVSIILWQLIRIAMPTLTFELHRYIWFFSEGAYKQGRLLAAMIENERDVFDGPIQSLPLPDDIPSEVPRIVLQDKSGHLILRSSPDRITLERLFTNAVPEEQVRSDLEVSVNLFTIAKEITSSRISRVAYNRDRTYDDDSAATHLVKYFVASDLASREAEPRGPLSRCENFEIHAHKTYPLGEVVINSWFRCKSARSRDGQRPVMSINQDLNTLAEDAATRDFAPNDAAAELDLMTREVQPIFDLYFPNGVPS